MWRREHRLDEARALIEAARRLFEKTHGARYELDLASCDEGLAGIDFDRGRADLALPLHQRVAEVRERIFGREHASVGVALVNLGEDLTRLGRAREAIPLLERAVTLAAPRADKGADGYFRHRLAAAFRAIGDAKAALAEDERAHAACGRAGEIGTHWESWSLAGIGLDLLALGRAAEAVPALERAVELQVSGSAPEELGETRFALARALRETGASTRARAVAGQALEDVREDAARYGSWFAALRDAITAWRDR